MLMLNNAPKYFIILPMRHHVARVSYDEHISNVGLSEPGGQHPGVHTGHEHRSGVGIISHPLEVLGACFSASLFDTS